MIIRNRLILSLLILISGCRVTPRISHELQNTHEGQAQRNIDRQQNFGLITTKCDFSVSTSDLVFESCTESIFRFRLECEIDQHHTRIPIRNAKFTLELSDGKILNLTSSMDGIASVKLGSSSLVPSKPFIFNYQGYVQRIDPQTTETVVVPTEKCGCKK